MIVTGRGVLHNCEESDTIDLSQWAYADLWVNARIWQSGGNIHIKNGAGDMLVIRNLAISELDAGDFVF